MSLEDIDLLFGERALGTLPDDLHKGPLAPIHPGEVEKEQVKEEAKAGETAPAAHGTGV